MSSGGRGWRAIPEAGTVLGIRFFAWLIRAAGRRVVSALLYVLSVYYALVRGPVRRSSREYLQKMGLPHGFWNIVQHLHHFAQTATDRVLFLTGNWSSLTIEHHGHENIIEAVRSKKGALLIGAHLGSFEAMRSLADKHQVPINIVADFSNAERVNRVLSALAPSAELRVISLAKGKDYSPITTVLTIKSAIERGELVAILADRHDEDTERTVEIECFGTPARFPTGPWILAHSLGCPVYFVAGLYSKPNRYDLHCEPLADQVRLIRGQREESIRTYVSEYGLRLERLARSAPYNWFNFYDFWSKS